jgi:DNA-binding MurR/RpiR family transcriptional regulator
MLSRWEMKSRIRNFIMAQPDSVSFAEIAHELGVSVSTIARIAKDAGVTRSKGRRLRLRPDVEALLSKYATLVSKKESDEPKSDL